MTRPKFRRSLRFDNLETRQLMAAGGPTAQQQYMLELVNQARTNPQAAADRVTSNLTPDVSATLDYYHVDLNAAKQAIATSAPKPPLAWNPALAAAAQGHSQDMANTQVQSHTGSDGSSPDQRMEQAGYTNHNSTGENAYAYSTSVDEAMQAFLLDWGVSDQGHRRNLLQPNVSSSNAFRDVGIGIVNTSNLQVRPDRDHAGFRQPSQLAGPTRGRRLFRQPARPSSMPRAKGRGTSRSTPRTSPPAPRPRPRPGIRAVMQLSLAPGQYQVIASLGGKVIQTVTLSIGTDNVEQDFILSNTWDGRSRDQVSNSVTPTNNGTSVTPIATPAVKTTSVSQAAASRRRLGRPAGTARLGPCGQL